MEEEESLRALRRERTARVKRILRWMPRRATMHRYPILKWFAKSARQRPYLWTFRTNAVIPALYAGCILSFLPLYGVQLALSVTLAFILRANLPILVALQGITNPLTAIPIYFACYQIGRVCLRLFGISPPHLNLSEITAVYSSVVTGDWSQSLSFIFMVLGLMSIGGAMIGVFVATIASVLYRLGAREAAHTFQRLQALQESRRLAAEAETHPTGQLKIPFPRESNDLPPSTPQP